MRSDKVSAVAAAAAYDFNNELTVILSSVRTSILALDPGHPARPHLFELENAAWRCARRSNGLLTFTARRGTKPAATPFDTLAELEPLAEAS